MTMSNVSQTAKDHRWREKQNDPQGLSYPGFSYRIATTEGVLAVSAASAYSALLAAEA